MTKTADHSVPGFVTSGWAHRWIVACFCVLTMLALRSAQAQTYNVVYSFSTAQGGYYPLAGVTVDRSGNLYGTTAYGGFGIGCSQGCGTAYKLARRGSGWLFTPLYNFRGGSDGGRPRARLVFGPDGILYGTTFEGGIGCSGGCGVIFSLRPPAHASPTALASWTETVLHLFAGVNDGSNPGSGDLVFDQTGNIYGTTTNGGGGFCPGQGCGTVYELTHTGGGWTESVLHSFAESGDATEPLGGVVFDQIGRLYGDTLAGGTDNRVRYFR